MILLKLILMFFRPGSFGLSDVAGLTGVGLGLNQLFGGGSKGFQPSNMGNADAWWGQYMQDYMGRQSAVAGQTDPEMLKTYQNMLGLDLSALGPAGVQAGQQYGALATQGQQDSSILNNAGIADISRGQQIWQNAQDPLNAQFDDERSKVLENTRSAQSARGVAMGDYGAGLEADQLNNLGIDWRKFQDQRQLNANQAVNASSASARMNFGQSMNTGAQVPGYTMSSVQAPIAGQEMIAQQPGQAAMQYSGDMYGSDPYAAILAQLGTYMGHTYNTFGTTPRDRSNNMLSGLGNIVGGLPAIGNAWESLFGGGGADAALAGGGLDAGGGIGAMAAIA